MNQSAQLGRLIVLAVIAVTALMELALAILSLQADRFRGSQLIRVALTAWLLWLLWDGARWSRWLVASLFFVAAIGAGVAAANLADTAKPEQATFLYAAVVVSALFGGELAAPWVGEFQAARRLVTGRT